MDKRLHIIEVVVCPSSVEQWKESDWDTLIQQAYATGFLARLYYILIVNELENVIPIRARWHFSSAYKVYLAHRLDVRKEVDHIVKVLQFVNITPIFLKGSAYLISEDRCAFGRMFADIDIFIQKSDIEAVEQILKWQGWKGSALEPHDDKYYRQWMHEIPPLLNIRSGMTLDVHHNLMPITSRVKFDITRLKEGAVARILDGKITLSKEDRLLHSALHLFLDGEFDKGFRDLCDMHLMLVEFSSNDGSFWSNLIVRSQELGVSRVLYYCLFHSKKIFDTNIPDEIMKQVSKFKGNCLVDYIMNKFFSDVLLPDHISCYRKSRTFSEKCLFLRGHWLKMPFHILVPHLLYKSFVTPYVNWKKSNKKSQDLKG